jgi:enoyl-CoA hydratase
VSEPEQPTAEPVILIEVAGGVMTITLNRPRVRNAVNHAMAVAIGSALDELDRRPDLVAGVLAGNGPAFCSGMDLKAFLAGERPTVPGRGFAGIAERGSDKPLIAAVEGYALAGGCELVLACDLVVAAENAKFGIPEVKRGLVAAGGGLIRLPRRIPPQVAMEYALTGDFFSAADGHRYGLVNRVTEPGGALAGALELAERITANAPLAIAATKEIIARSADWTSDDMFRRQEDLVRPILESADAREGASAFAEKRAPAWRGE